MSKDIKIKDTPLVEELKALDKLPISDGSGDPKGVNIDLIKQYIEQQLPIVSNTIKGLMSPEDKIKLDFLNDTSGGLSKMTIYGTVNLTDNTVYSSIFTSMTDTEMRLYIVADSKGELPSSETAVVVPYDGILSPASIYFGKNSKFGVSVGDICVFYKLNALLGICRIIALNDVKPTNGDFPGADGLSTVWDKERINKVDGIEWTANHVRDTYLPFTTRDGSNMNECLESGVYPWCSSGRPEGSEGHFTCITYKSTTSDWSGYYTYHLICFGREGNDLGKIYQRVFFLKTDPNDNPNWGQWKRIDNIELEEATLETAGLLSVSDKKKLDSIKLENELTLLVENNIQANNFIKTGGTSTQILMADGSTSDINELSTDFDSSGTYPNLTAGKATKLATARKIGITGGAVGTGTNFDGSNAINIPVTKIDESFITWTTASKRAYGSVTDNLMKNGQQNSFAFMPPDAVTIEYTNDSGVTWLDYGLTDNAKTKFLTPLVGAQALKVGKDGADLADTAQLRITLDFIKANMSLELRKIMLRIQTFLGTPNGSVRIKILSELYENYDADIWDEFIDETVVSSGWMSLPVTNKASATWGHKGSGSSYPAKLRVIFYRTGTPKYNTSLLNIVGLSNYMASGDAIAKYCWPCTMDVSKNATFPANITATKHITQDGTSSQVVLGDGSLISFDELKTKLGIS